MRKGRPIEFAIPVLIVVVVVCVVVFTLAGERRKKLDEVYLRVAHAYDGQCVTGGIFRRPAVRFTRHGVSVLLDIYSTGGEHATYYTQLHLGYAERELRMEVFPESLVRSLGKLLGTQDIIIGSPQFDRDYIIRGNDERRIATLLTEPVQVRIDALRVFLWNNDIYVGAKAGTLLIKKREFIREFSTLNSFVTLGLELYDEMTGVGAEGIDFVAGEESSFSPDSSDTACQICGEAMKSDRVYCRSCKTPHHQDCWAYYGKCSTYGCGESRYKTPGR